MLISLTFSDTRFDDGKLSKAEVEDLVTTMVKENNYPLDAFVTLLAVKTGEALGMAAPLLDAASRAA